MTEKAYKSDCLEKRMGKVCSVLLISCMLLMIFTVPAVSAFSFSDLLEDLGLGNLASYDSVYKQNWGHICCVQEDAFDYYTRYVDDPSGFFGSPMFSCDHYTDECYLRFYNNRGIGFGAIGVCYQICDIDGKNCGGESCRIGWDAFQSEGWHHNEITLKYGESIKFSNMAGWKWISYEAKWKNFYIKGQENGKIYRQESCSLDSDLKKRVLVDGLNELSRSGANSCQNYMIDFVKVATKTYDYKGREVICQARQVFDIDERSFKDGNVRKVQGDLIDSVECCPHESNCDEDTFRFVQNNKRECTYSSECANGGNPVAVSGTSYINFVCQSGTCEESEEKYAECTNNAICIQKYGKNSVCDLSPNNFGNCIDNSEWIGYCGDGVCESILGETTNNCPNDCGFPVKKSGLAWYWWVLIALVAIAVITKLLGFW